MTFHHFADHAAMSAAAADWVSEMVQENPESHMALPTGGSPEGLFRELSARGGMGQVWVTKLDEWLDLPAGHPGSCEAYLREYVLGPWGTREERYLAFDDQTADPEAECRRIETDLKRRPPIDLVVLGIGANGHIGMNEPGEHLVPGPHVSVLAQTSRSHAMIAGVEPPPWRGMTLGVGDILRARRVLLLVSGQGKAEALALLRQGAVTTALPASLLYLHPDAVCMECL